MKNALLRCLAAILLLACSGTGTAARVMLIESDVGLPDKQITAIARDHRGLMWIGTRQGLCRFDGYRFIVLQHPALQTAAIHRLHQIPGTDIIWVAAGTGLFRLQCSTLTVTQVRIPGDEAVAATCTGPGTGLYAASSSGAIYSIDTAGRQRRLLRLPPGNRTGDRASRIDAEGRDALLIRMELSNQYFIADLLRKQIDTLGVSAMGMNPYFIKRSGPWRVIFGAGRLFLQDTAAPLMTPAVTAPSYRFPNIVDVATGHDGTVYALGRPSRLFRLDPASARRDTIQSELFTGRTFNCFFFDPDGIIWIGTNKGLLKLSNDRHLFRQLLVRNPPVSVRTIAADAAGTVYAGTYSGLFRSVDDGGSWQHISTQLPNRILDAPGPYLYFAGGDSCLYRLRKRDGAVQSGFWTGPAPSRQQIGEAYSMFRDGSRLWIGGSHGLFCYDTGAHTFRAWAGNSALPEDTHISYISASGAGRLWLCTNHGLYEVDPAGAVTAQFTSSSRPALSNNRLVHATADTAGNTWLCTAGGGINILSRDRREIRILGTTDGLANNETYQLLWHSPQQAWISTFNGLSRYDLRSRRFYNYYIADGLTTNEFNHNAFMQDARGRIWFGSINGINCFAPDSIGKDAGRSALFVSSISKWDSRHTATRELAAADTGTTIVLLPQDHSLSFTLGLTDYTLPESNTFMYRLPGVFDEWERLEGAQPLRLDGLAPGRYTLELMALDGRGVPAANMLRYRLEVREAFYKTWWFYLALLVVTSLLIWTFFRMRLLNIKRVQRLRQQIASDLHDEVGSLLTRITMTSDNLRYSRNPDAEKAAKLEKIAALSRNASSSMSDILWAIDARNDYTGNLSDRMREHAEEMLLPLDIDLKFDIQLSQRMSISSELRQQFYLIYKEAVNNIVKHSQATQVRVLYHHSERGFRLEIRNNGSRDDEKAGARSQGLKNMLMRAGRIGAQLDIEKGDGWFSITLTGR